MKKSMVINGTKYEVEIGDMTISPVEVLVNGKAYSVELPAEEATVPLPAVKAAAPVVAAPVVVKAAPKAAPAVVVDGNGNDVRAPMPGVIRDVLVKAGDEVKAGQQLVSLEAMKMKNAIRSPRDTKVISVEVTDGQKVAYNDILVHLA